MNNTNAIKITTELIRLCSESGFSRYSLLDLAVLLAVNSGMTRATEIQKSLKLETLSKTPLYRPISRLCELGLIKRVKGGQERKAQFQLTAKGRKLIDRCNGDN